MGLLAVTVANGPRPLRIPLRSNSTRGMKPFYISGYLSYRMVYQERLLKRVVSGSPEFFRLFSLQWLKLSS